MKKLFHSVALALAVLLAAQPAFAAMTCAQNLCGQAAANCCMPSAGMSMAGMSMDGPSHPAAAMKCDSDGCCTVSARTSTPLLPVGKFVVSALELIDPGTRALPVLDGTDEVSGLSHAAAPIPARYLMFHAFRI